MSCRTGNSAEPRGTGGLEHWNGQCHEDIDRVPDALCSYTSRSIVPPNPANWFGRSNLSPPARGIQGAARSAPWPRATGRGRPVNTAPGPHPSIRRKPEKATVQPKRNGHRTRVRLRAPPLLLREVTNLTELGGTDRS